MVSKCYHKVLIYTLPLGPEMFGQWENYDFVSLFQHSSI